MPLPTNVDLSNRAPAMLVAFHCRSNTGYAIGRLERAFLAVARRLVESDDRIHFSFTSLSGGHPTTTPPAVRVVSFNPFHDAKRNGEIMAEYIRAHNIQLGLGFDFQVRSPAYAPIRRAGLRAFVSYWGAPISSEYRGLALRAKRLEVALARHQPDRYVFESDAMRHFAVNGRGIPAERTEVCPTGVDADRFVPRPSGDHYAHECLGLPPDRRIIFYSGHMEERKGVAVLVRAVRELVVNRGRRDLHLVILGNKGDEADRFDPWYRGTAAEAFVTFGGYREDIAEIMGSSYVGVIPSTGWDSFPMSALEMASSGLPLIASRLHGIPETLAEGRTGVLFPPGDHLTLADELAGFLDDPARRAQFSAAARARILGIGFGAGQAQPGRVGFTLGHQIDRLTSILAATARWRSVALAAT